MDPITWLRQFRIGGFAIFDFSISFLAIYLLAPALSRLCKKGGVIVPTSSWMYLTVPISVLIHLLIGRITPLTADAIDPSGHYLVKIAIVILCGLGFRNVKRAVKN
jgi:hypothetical protein